MKAEFIGEWSDEEKAAVLSHADGKGYEWICEHDKLFGMLPAFYHAKQTGWKGCFCALTVESLISKITESVDNFERSGVWFIP